VLSPPGLAGEVFTELLRSAGMALTEPVDADVAVLVEPLPEHWATARGRGLPILLVLDEAAEDAHVAEAVLAGADAVAHPDTPPATIFGMLAAIGAGGSVLLPNQARIVANVARAAAAHPEVVLSRREAEIVASIAEGKAVKQTARDLGISAKTVENLQGRLFRKLGVRNRAQAVARAHGLGLL
jgi:DNA-binding NarL/FixJ family response regulator